MKIRINDDLSQEIKSIEFTNAKGESLDITQAFDYDKMENIPQINGVDLSGNKSLEDIGAQPAGSYLTAESDPTVPSHVKSITQNDIDKWNTSETYDDTEIRQEIADVDTKADDAVSKAETAEAIAKGRATGYVFDTKADMDTWLDDEDNIKKLVLGDNLYIRDVDTPDYWWDGVQAQELETQKVDLTNYYTKEQTYSKSEIDSQDLASKSYVDDAIDEVPTPPVGGTVGQVLGKKSDEDYDVEWIDQTGGEGADNILLISQSLVFTRETSFHSFEEFSNAWYGEEGHTREDFKKDVEDLMNHKKILVIRNDVEVSTLNPEVNGIVGCAISPKDNSIGCLSITITFLENGGYVTTKEFRFTRIDTTGIVNVIHRATSDLNPVANLDTDDDIAPLAASQGKILNDKIEEIKTISSESIPLNSVIAYDGDDIPEGYEETEPIGGSEEIFIGPEEEAPEDIKLIITDEYVDYDQFPLGTVIEYNGDVVPDGYKEVDSYSNILVSPTEPTMSNKPDVWVKYSKNLCNPLMFVNDRYQNALATNTTLSANTNYWVTGLQFCEEGKTYYVNQEFNNCTFFDGNKVMNLNNDYEKGYVPTSKTFTVPTGIKYFQLCFAKSVVKYDTPIIVSEIENLTYEPYVKPEIMIYNEGKYNTFYNKDIYSGEEQRIGTWVDGSPLYQYTVKLTRDVVSSGNQTNYSCPVSGYKNIWMDLSSSFIELSNKTILNFDTYQSSTDYAKVTIGTGDNSIRFLYGDQWRAVSVTLYITLRYTKLVG